MEPNRDRGRDRRRNKGTAGTWSGALTITAMVKWCANCSRWIMDVKMWVTTHRAPGPSTRHTFTQALQTTNIYIIAIIIWVRQSPCAHHNHRVCYMSSLVMSHINNITTLCLCNKHSRWMYFRNSFVPWTDGFISKHKLTWKILKDKDDVLGTN